MIPYQLDLITVKQKAREYYEAKKLTAQHPNTASRVCANKIDDYRCAVSACYPDEVLEHVFGTVEHGVELGYLLPPKDHLEWAQIVRLQMIHDFWADLARRYPDDPITAEFEKTFRDRIQLFSTLMVE